MATISTFRRRREARFVIPQISSSENLQLGKHTYAFSRKPGWRSDQIRRGGAGGEEDNGGPWE